MEASGPYSSDELVIRWAELIVEDGANLAK